MDCKAHDAANGGDHDTVRVAASAGMVAGGRSRKRLLRITSDLASVVGSPGRMAITNDLPLQRLSQMASCFTSSFISNVSHATFVARLAIIAILSAMRLMEDLFSVSLKVSLRRNFVVIFFVEGNLAAFRTLA